MQSIWSHFADSHEFPQLKEGILTDVAIIGGGITGISAGCLLAQQGRKVVVLESRKVGGGTSGHSTGNLYFTIDKPLSSLKSKYDNETVKKVAQSRSEALKQVAMWVSEYNLDCDFKRVPWHLYSNDEKNKSRIDDEYKTGRKAGLPMKIIRESEMPVPAVRALKLDEQGQINPMRYVQELAKKLQSENFQIYEQTHVSSVKEQGNHYKLMTPDGIVTAANVIHATHTPKGVKAVQTLLGPYREYGIACRMEEGVHPDGIFWGYFDGNKKISTRNYSRNGEHFLIVVGEPHKVGHAKDNKQHIEKLESFAREYFDVQDVAFRWGGQHYRPADLLPYIGTTFRSSGEFFATGYSTDGLIYGTLAGVILSDLITAKENQWADLYRSTRKQPLKSASKFAKENIDVAKQYIKDLTGKAEDLDLSHLKPGEGKIAEQDGHKLAVYRHEDGKLDVRSAVCTHLKCIVQWNNAEKSWDCPCHGSRFETDGSVLEGPAFDPLRRVKFSDDS
ncbi:MAG TPA: FAD-dependent oxidoreductase [Balneolaceae bacterium]